MTGPKVYAAIASVVGDMAKEGISKDRKNQQQGYSFRGIDDVFNALSPLLAKHKLCVLPRILSRETVEKTNRNGNVLFYTVVDAEFDFVSAEDGSKHTVKMFGEAMDSGDKSTNKAMSAAFKYAALQAFCIPTESDHDPDNTTHEVVADKKPSQQSTQKRNDAPKGNAQTNKTNASGGAKNEPVSEATRLEEVSADLLDCKTVQDVNKVGEAWKFIADRDGWSRETRIETAKRCKAAREALSNPPDDRFPGDYDYSNHPLNAG